MMNGDPISQILAVISDLASQDFSLPAAQQTRFTEDLQKLKSLASGLQSQSKNDIPKNGRSSTEGELKEALARLAWLARIPDENPNPVVRVGLDGTVLYCNRASAKLEGWPAREGEHLGGVLQALLNQTHGRPLTQDLAVGEKNYVVYLVPYMDEQYANLFGIDITKRVRLEAELHKSEAILYASSEALREKEVVLKEANDRFRIMADGTPVIIWVTNTSGGIEFVNQAYCDFFGATLEEVQSSGWQVMVHPEDTARYLDEFAECVRERRTFRAQGRVRRADGVWRWVDTHGKPRFSESGEFLGMVGSSLDITERMQAEEALRVSEDRERARANELEALMDAFPALVWISRDSQCREMIGNRYGYEFLQLGPGANLSKTAPEDALSAQPYTNLKDGRPIPPEELPMQIAAATGKPAQDYTFDILFKDGSLYHLLGNVNPLFDREGNPNGAVGVFIDISRVRQLESERVDTLAQIEVQRRLMDLRERERQGIARDIHDGPIQTLASTGFNIQILREAYPDPKLNVELEQIAYNIKTAVRELREVVKDLRPPSLTRFGLPSTIQMHAEDLQERHPELRITLSLEEDGPQLSDQASLTLFRIFQEGMNNVIHHSKATRVWVRYQTTESDFLLELKDNGQGFAIQNDISQIFSEGHFGLVGMKERAQAVGGEFSITSAPGKGTTISVRGPLLANNVKEG